MYDAAPEFADLLHIHFFSQLDFIPSLNTLGVFLSVLADQLRKFTRSSWFNPEFNVELGTQRSIVVRSLVVCARDFATRSVVHARQRQEHSITSASASSRGGGKEQAVPDWMHKGLVQWEESFPPMLIFDDHACMMAIYRNPRDVDPQIAALIKEQERSQALPDWFSMTEVQLRDELAKICGGRPGRELGPAAYRLTPDNFLKINMILMRIEANVPCVLVGETGCGKVRRKEREGGRGRMIDLIIELTRS